MSRNTVIKNINDIKNIDEDTEVLIGNGANQDVIIKHKGSLYSYKRENGSVVSAVKRIENPKEYLGNHFLIAEVIEQGKNAAELRQEFIQLLEADILDGGDKVTKSKELVSVEYFKPIWRTLYNFDNKQYYLAANENSGNETLIVREDNSASIVTSIEVLSELAGIEKKLTTDRKTRDVRKAIKKAGMTDKVKLPLPAQLTADLLKKISDNETIIDFNSAKYGCHEVSEGRYSIYSVDNKNKKTPVFDVSINSNNTNIESGSIENPLQQSQETNSEILINSLITVTKSERRVIARNTDQLLKDVSKDSELLERIASSFSGQPLSTQNPLLDSETNENTQSIANQSNATTQGTGRSGLTPTFPNLLKVLPKVSAITNLFSRPLNNSAQAESDQILLNSNNSSGEESSSSNLFSNFTNQPMILLSELSKNISEIGSYDNLSKTGLEEKTAEDLTAEFIQLIKQDEGVQESSLSKGESLYTLYSSVTNSDKKYYSGIVLGRRVLHEYDSSKLFSSSGSSRKLTADEIQAKVDELKQAQRERGIADELTQEIKSRLITDIQKQSPSKSEAEAILIANQFLGFSHAYHRGSIGSIKAYVENFGPDEVRNVLKTFAQTHYADFGKSTNQDLINLAGVFCELGIHVNPSVLNTEEALAHYKLAANAGSSAALDNVIRCYKNLVGFVSTNTTDSNTTEKEQKEFARRGEILDALKWARDNQILGVNYVLNSGFEVDVKNANGAPVKVTITADSGFESEGLEERIKEIEEQRASTEALVIPKGLDESVLRFAVAEVAKDTAKVFSFEGINYKCSKDGSGYNLINQAEEGKFGYRVTFEKGLPRVEKITKKDLAFTTLGYSQYKAVPFDPKDHKELDGVVGVVRGEFDEEVELEKVEVKNDINLVEQLTDLVQQLTDEIYAQINPTRIDPQKTEAKKIVDNFLRMSESFVDKEGKFHFYGQYQEVGKEVQAILDKFAKEYRESFAASDDDHLKLLACDFYCLDEEPNIEGNRSNQYKAFEIAKKLAEAGNPIAKNKLGFFYQTGYGVKADSAEAKKLYKEAADQGYPKGYFMLARTYDKDKSSFGTKIGHYETSANLGLAEGMYEAGRYYLEYAPSKFIDAKKAVEYFKKGADLGHAASMERLAFCYEKGIGDTDKELKNENDRIGEAFRFYQAAAMLGNSRAIKSLVNILKDGNQTIVVINADFADKLESLLRLMQIGAEVDGGDGYKYKVGFEKNKGFVITDVADENRKFEFKVEFDTSVSATKIANSTNGSSLTVLNADRVIDAIVAKAAQEKAEAETRNKKTIVDRATFQNKGLIRSPEKLLESSGRELLEKAAANKTEVCLNNQSYRCFFVRNHDGKIAQDQGVKNSFVLYAIDFDGKRDESKSHYEISFARKDATLNEFDPTVTKLKPNFLDMNASLIGNSRAEISNSFSEDGFFANLIDKIAAVEKSRPVNFSNANEYEAISDLKLKNFDQGTTGDTENVRVSFKTYANISGEEENYEITSHNDSFIIAKITNDPTQGEKAEDLFLINKASNELQVFDSAKQSYDICTDSTKFAEAKRILGLLKGQHDVHLKRINKKDSEISDNLRASLKQDKEFLTQTLELEILNKLKEKVDLSGLKKEKPPYDIKQVEKAGRYTYSVNGLEYCIVDENENKGAGSEKFVLKKVKYVVDRDSGFSIKKPEPRFIAEELNASEINQAVSDINSAHLKEKDDIIIKSLIDEIAKFVGKEDRIAKEEARQIVHDFLGLSDGEFLQHMKVGSPIGEKLAKFALAQFSSSNVAERFKSESFRDNVGAFFIEKKVAKKSAVKFLDLYRKSANAGNVHAQNNLGRLLEEADASKGVITGAAATNIDNHTFVDKEEARKEAFKLYKAAAKQGDQAGLKNVIRCLRSGIGVEKDDKKVENLETMQWANSRANLKDQTWEGWVLGREYRVLEYNPQKGFVVTNVKNQEVARVKHDGSAIRIVDGQEVGEYSDFSEIIDRIKLNKDDKASENIILEGRAEVISELTGSLKDSVEKDLKKKELAKGIQNPTISNDKIKTEAEKISKIFFTNRSDNEIYQTKQELFESLSLEERKVVEKFSRKNVLALSESKSAQFQDLAGQIYFHGIGVDKDYEAARKCFEEAGEKDFPEAKYHLAVMYINGGFGIEQNHKKAFELFEEAARKGFQPAIASLANCYEDGIGCKKDKELTMSLYGLKGTLNSRSEIAGIDKFRLEKYPAKIGRNAELMLEDELTDHAEVMQLLNKLAPSNPNCYTKIGKIFEGHHTDYTTYSSSDSPPDYKKAAEQYKFGSKAGSRSSILALADLHEQGKVSNSDISRSPERARQLRKIAEIFDVCAQSQGSEDTRVMVKSSTSYLPNAKDIYRVSKFKDSDGTAGYLITINGEEKNGFKIDGQGNFYVRKDGVDIFENRGLDENPIFARAYEAMITANNEQYKIASSGISDEVWQNLTKSLEGINIPHEQAKRFAKDFLGLNIGGIYHVVENGGNPVASHLFGNIHREIDNSAVKEVLKNFAVANLEYCKKSPRPHLQNLAGMFYEMDLIKSDNKYEEAAKFYEVAANKGYIPAQHNLACCRATGSGVGDIKIYEETAKKGYLPSVKAVAEILEKLSLGKTYENTAAKLLSNLAQIKIIGATEFSLDEGTKDQRRYKVSEYDPEKGFTLKLVNKLGMVSDEGFLVSSLEKTNLEVVKIRPDGSACGIYQEDFEELFKIIESLEGKNAAIEQEDRQCLDKAYKPILPSLSKTSVIGDKEVKSYTKKPSKAEEIKKSEFLTPKSEILIPEILQKSKSAAPRVSPDPNLINSVPKSSCMAKAAITLMKVLGRGH